MWWPRFVDQLPETFFRYSHVLKHLSKILTWKLSIKPTHERDPLLPRQVPISDLLRSIGACSPQTELDKGGKVVKPIDTVINTIIFTVGSFGPNRIGLEAGGEVDWSLGEVPVY